ncbi:MAG: hypothetical protein H3C51_03700 [Rubellimicrobium sp.]|nr:hypothetical protein [Rubellimicrobium sp.]
MPLIATLALAGCAAPVAGFMPGETVQVAGDTFTVTVDGNRAVARNFATGLHNQDRLYANAQAAIAQVSGCAVGDFAQDPGVNTYRARLHCA